MSRRTAAFVVSLLAMTIGAATAEAADVCLATTFKCDDFEPNWQFTTHVVPDGGDTVTRFTDPENPDWETEPLVVLSCLLQGSPNDYELRTDEPLSLVADIVGQSCVQPNDDVTGFSVIVSYMQGAMSGDPRRVEGTGCCQIVE